MDGMAKITRTKQITGRVRRKIVTKVTWGQSNTNSLHMLMGGNPNECILRSCSWCGEWKHLNDFYPKPGRQDINSDDLTADDLRSHCKCCHDEDIKERRSKH